MRKNVHEILSEAAKITTKKGSEMSLNYGAGVDITSKLSLGANVVVSNNYASPDFDVEDVQIKVGYKFGKNKK